MASSDAMLADKPKVVAGLTFGLSFCSFSYHLLIANTLALLTGGSTKWHSLTVGCYLLGLGWGTWRRETRTPTDPARTLLGLELRMAVIGGLSALAILGLHIFYRIWFQGDVMSLFGEHPAYAGAVYDSARFLPWLFFIGFAMLMATFIGIQTGHELPLLKMVSQARDYQPLLSWNYFGTVASGLLLALWVVPSLSLSFAALTVGGLNLAMVAWLWLSQPARARRGWLLIPAAGVLLVAALFAADLHQLQLKTFYHYRHGAMAPQASWGDALNSIADKPKVDHQRSLYQTLDVTEIQWPNTPPVATLFLNGHFQFDTRQERFYHELMAHGGAYLAGIVPRRVLVLGAGDGLVVRELLKYGEQIESVTLIELDPAVVALVDRHPSLAGLNQGALQAPQVTVQHQDALSFIRKTRAEFDAVLIDFPFPTNYDLAKLYSVEFYQLVRRRLAPGGYMIASAPIYEVLADEEQLSEFQQQLNDILFSTIAAAGFEDRRGLALYGDAFLFARAQESTGQAAGIDLPDALFALQPAHLDLVDTIRFPHTIAQERVHSIFRPRLLSVDDPTF